jgi:hypothetical protein
MADSPEAKPLVRELTSQGSHYGWVFWCPGCEEPHQIDSKWTFNGDVHKPTIRASVLVRSEDHSSGAKVDTRCHLFVTDGKIQFLGDCTHSLKGKTVDMEPLPWD